jgi:hypothetical protein
MIGQTSSPCELFVFFSRSIGIGSGRNIPHFSQDTLERFLRQPIAKLHKVIPEWEIVVLLLSVTCAPSNALASAIFVESLVELVELHKGIAINVHPLRLPVLVERIRNTLDDLLLECWSHKRSWHHGSAETKRSL